MLIKCPECGKEISNKAKQCIHCGYPLSNENSNFEAIDTIELENFLECPICHTKGNMKTCPVCGYKVGDEIPDIEIIKRKLNEDNEKLKKDLNKTMSTPCCPKCNSTSIQVVPRKWTLLGGFATNKVDLVCNQCGTVVK